MHAMMDAEQILEHARAAEAAGAHRFCMVTQGQGLSKRDFEKILAGARLVSEHTNLKRCVSIGHMSPARAKALKDAGVQRVHHNVETAESYYPEVSSTVRYEGRIRTVDAVREAGLETCVGGILNLGESREQRVEMAFQLSALNPTSVPINLLNPRPGTKFGDRELMDPWEAVQWVAIFRLIIPDALFRLCGGRNENLGDGEFQKLAVKAGLNGVMMGNFLTTLGSEPEWDRQMFEELGLNVARQEDNGANPRPDNRSGWLEGEAPADARGRADRFAGRRQLLGPLDPASPQEEDVRAAPPGRSREHLPRTDPRGARRMTTDIQDRLDEIRDKGLYRRMRCVSGPQGPRVLLDGKPVLLLCSNNYLGLADHPRVREAAAEAAMRYGAGSGASRLISGNMTIHRRLEEQLASFKHSRGLPAVRFRVPGERGRGLGAGARGRRGLLRRPQPREHRGRLPALASGDVRLRPPRHGPPRVGPAPGGGPRVADRDRWRLLHGWRRRTAGAHRRAGAALRRARDGRRGARHGRDRAGRARRRGRGGAGGRGRRDRRHPRQGARLLRRLRVLRHADGEVPDQHRAHADLLHRAVATGRGGCDGRARAAARAAAARGEAAAQRIGAAGGAGGRRVCPCRTPRPRSCRW